MAPILASTRDGLFAASCLLHCGFTLDGPLIRGENAISALFKWAAEYWPRNDAHGSSSDTGKN